MKKFTPPSPSFCALPWVHLSTKPNGEIRLCCIASTSGAGKHGSVLDASGARANLAKSSLNEAWNNEYMRTVRRQMLKGEKPLACSSCHKDEASGVRSKRQWETWDWSSRIDLNRLIQATEESGAVPEKIRYLDLRFGNFCNLRCIMCRPDASSSWMGDWEKLEDRLQSPDLRKILPWDKGAHTVGTPNPWHKDKKFLAELFLQIPFFEQLFFAGGEPLLHEEHYALLEECVRQGHAEKITLRYNSNGTYLPERVLELWKSFRRVYFEFSLDSVGPMNHYIRYPSNWSLIEKNLRKLDETGDSVEVNLAGSVQALNIFYLPEFIQWKIAQGFRKVNSWPVAAGLINFHLVYYPAHLNIKSLPRHAKQAIADKFELFYVWLSKNYRSDQEFLEGASGTKRLEAMIEYMFSEDWSDRHSEFVEYITVLDAIRGTSFAGTFPEFAKILNFPNSATYRILPSVWSAEPSRIL